MFTTAYIVCHQKLFPAHKYKSIHSITTILQHARITSTLPSIYGHYKSVSPIFNLTPTPTAPPAPATAPAATTPPTAAAPPTTATSPASGSVSRREPSVATGSVHVVGGSVAVVAGSDDERERIALDPLHESVSSRCDDLRRLTQHLQDAM